jgi:ketosteroid isomerase-like protein
MGIQDQERLAIAYVHSIGTGGPDRAWLATDFTAWSSISGMMRAEDYLPKLPVVKAIFATPLTMTVDHLTSQPGRTALQCRSRGVLFNGAVYANDYHILVEFDDDGKIRHVREYMDSQRAHDILMPAFREWMARTADSPSREA